MEYDPKLLTILNTPPPRRKRNKNVQKTRSDSFSNEQYFITELRYRKDFICRVFDFYAKDQKRLFLSELRILINDVEDSDEACKDMYMAMLPGVEEKDLDNHPGARLPDFVNWLWDSLSPMEKAERQNVSQEFINIALQQPGAKKEILSNLL